MILDNFVCLTLSIQSLENKSYNAIGYMKILNIAKCEQNDEFYIWCTQYYVIALQFDVQKHKFWYESLLICIQECFLR